MRSSARRAAASSSARKRATSGAGSASSVRAAPAFSCSSMGPPIRTIGRAGGSEVLAAAVSVLAAATLALVPARPAAGLRRNHVVDPKDHDRRVRRGADRLEAHADRLEDLHPDRVLDLPGEDVDRRRLPAPLVLLPQVDER